jgi:hypothetical protein
MTEIQKPALPPSTPAPSLPWVPLLALLAVHVSNQWSRALIYYVNNFNGDADATDAAFRYCATKRVDSHKTEQSSKYRCRTMKFRYARIGRVDLE